MLNEYKKDFPLLNEKMNGKPLIYLDNAATTHKPNCVINGIEEYYAKYNANPYRGVYDLSVKSTDLYENARQIVADFIGAKSSKQIIFTRNATEALNILAYSYGTSVIEKGDEIVLSISEHHSNIIPWQQVVKQKGGYLTYLNLDQNGHITNDEIDEKITKKTKIVSVAFVSNVLGTIHPVEKIIKKAHSVGAVVILDCAQSIPHYPIHVEKLDVDFIAFSGHKMLGPMGIGVLYGKESLLNEMPPFLTGGEMMKNVDKEKASFALIPLKFEAGTPNVEGAIGLSEAIKYIKKVGYNAIIQIEDKLTKYALEQIITIPHITIYGEKEKTENRLGVISFNIDNIHPHDVASILDADGIAIRAGHQCAQPLMKFLDLEATCRISLYFYNTKEDIDTFIKSLRKVKGVVHGN
jgi:cysteine desulfurase/selenocysteine lyase